VKTSPSEQTKARRTEKADSPFDGDPLFHLWLLQLSITCFLIYNLIDTITCGLSGFWIIVWLVGFLLLGIYTHLRKK